MNRWSYRDCEDDKGKIPDVPVLVGGTHASILAEEIVSKYSDCVDGVLKGEAEIPSLNCVRRIEEWQAFGRC